MKITDIRLTPLLVPYSRPYTWAQGVILGAELILVEVETDTGHIGHGECIATPDAHALMGYLRRACDLAIGRSPFENAAIMATAYHQLFQAFGTCSAPRFAGQVLAGLEMALWDVAGRAVDQPVHALLGGAVRDGIDYFGFAMGETPQEIAADAKSFADRGFDVIYVKTGQGAAIDLEIVRQVRHAIGPDKRLRIDPNEHWPILMLRRMLPKLAPYDIEFIEQPVDAESKQALAQARAASPIAIAADQSVFTPYEAYDLCREGAAELIVLGLHETGGITRFIKVARIAEAAGVPICLHGLYESGITTCATHQAGLVIPNLDDGNQYMGHFLEYDLIDDTGHPLKAGHMPRLSGPGLGFTINTDAVKDATKCFSSHHKTT